MHVRVFRTLLRDNSIGKEFIGIIKHYNANIQTCTKINQRFTNGIGVEIGMGFMEVPNAGNPTLFIIATKKTTFFKLKILVI